MRIAILGALIATGGLVAATVLLSNRSAPIQDDGGYAKLVALAEQATPTTAAAAAAAIELALADPLQTAHMTTEQQHTLLAAAAKLRSHAPPDAPPDAPPHAPPHAPPDKSRQTTLLISAVVTATIAFIVCLALIIKYQLTKDKKVLLPPSKKISCTFQFEEEYDIEPVQSHGIRHPFARSLLSKQRPEFDIKVLLDMYNKYLFQIATLADNFAERSDDYFSIGEIVSRLTIVQQSVYPKTSFTLRWNINVNDVLHELGLKQLTLEEEKIFKDVIVQKKELAQCFQEMSGKTFFDVPCYGDAFDEHRHRPWELFNDYHYPQHDRVFLPVSPGLHINNTPLLFANAIYCPPSYIDYNLYLYVTNWKHIYRELFYSAKCMSESEHIYDIYVTFRQLWRLAINNNTVQLREILNNKKIKPEKIAQIYKYCAIFAYNQKKIVEKRLISFMESKEGTVYDSEIHASIDGMQSAHERRGKVVKESFVVGVRIIDHVFFKERVHIS